MTKDENPDPQIDPQTGPQSGLQSGPKHRARPDDARPKPRRFYKEVGINGEASGFAILLDGRPIKTPMKQGLHLPNESMAKAVAEEWRQQGEHIDHETMILTKLANTALDRVRGREDEIIGEITSYAASDLLLYRATEPQTLSQREEEQWGPSLSWLKERNNISFTCAGGIIHVTQEEAELEKFSHLLTEFNHFSLTAIHNMTTLTGSAILALAVAKQAKTAEAAWQAAHVDEDFQIERWGEDVEATRRRKIREKDFLTAYHFLHLAGEVN